MIPATLPSPSGLPALGGDPLGAVVLSELPMAGPVPRDPQPGGFAAQLAASRQPWDAAGEPTIPRSAPTALAGEKSASLAPAAPWPGASTLAMGAAWPSPAGSGEASASASTSTSALVPPPGSNQASTPGEAIGTTANAMPAARSAGAPVPPPQALASSDAAPDAAPAARVDTAAPLPAGAGPLASWLAQWSPPEAKLPSSTPATAPTPTPAAPLAPTMPSLPSVPSGPAASMPTTGVNDDARPAPAGTPAPQAAGAPPAALTTASAPPSPTSTRSPEAPRVDDGAEPRRMQADDPPALPTAQEGEPAGERRLDRVLDLRTAPGAWPPAGSEPASVAQAAEATARETEPDRKTPPATGEMAAAAAPLLPPAALPIALAPATTAAMAATPAGAAATGTGRAAPTPGQAIGRAGAERSTGPSLLPADPTEPRPTGARSLPASSERPSGPNAALASAPSPSPTGSSTTAAGAAPAAPPAALPPRGWAASLSAGDPPPLPLGLPGSEPLPRIAERPAAAPAVDATLGPVAGSGLSAVAPPPAGPTDTPSVALSTPVLAPEFREALGVQVSLLARDGIEQAELQLNPVDMGPIAIRIELDGQQAQISFGVENPQTRAIVEASLPELASALRDAGLTLTGGGVSEHPRGQAGGAAGGGPGGGSGGEHPPRPDHARHGSSDAAGERAPEPRPRTTHRLVGAGGIDLYA